MKFVVLFVTVALVAGLVNSNPLTKEVKEFKFELDNKAEVADANAFVDAILKNLSDNAIASGLDPMQLPDATYEFTVIYFFVIYHGTVTYSKGWLQNLSTIRRFGDAQVSQVGNTLEIKTDITFSQLHMQYQYKASIWGLGPEGDVISTIDDMIMFMDLVVDLDTCETLLKNMYISDAGKLDIHLEGTWFYDVIWNAMLDWFTFLFRDVILALIESNVRDHIDNALPNINFGDVTGIPCGPTEAPVALPAIRAH